jgi:hypothetical protein
MKKGLQMLSCGLRSCYRPLLTMQKGWCPQAFASLLLGTVLKALAASLRDVVHARAILATTTMVLAMAAAVVVRRRKGGSTRR